MSGEATNTEKRYTYGEYKTWPDEQRCELIDGRIYMLAAPALMHQSVISVLQDVLFTALRGSECSSFTSPCDVVFGDGDKAKNVVQPDIVVWCKHEKTKPSVVVEVLSHSTALKDLNEKMRLYERYGVPEYWVLSPERRSVTQYVLSRGQYEERNYNTGTLTSDVLPGVSFDVASLYAAADEALLNTPQ